MAQQTSSLAGLAEEPTTKHKPGSLPAAKRRLSQDPSPFSEDLLAHSRSLSRSWQRMIEGANASRFVVGHDQEASTGKECRSALDTTEPRSMT
ncbi:hypothetical protein N7495_003656 [Penicillium taxi]|uniref:uncharacterized protein n=1 Tax=Penicillium taxi TaxID=168475 RepID=UPI002544FFD5|nr:uncharacterized protein N7495_003656 [Penicillium taxi]KAJ5898912.1 hypothetical protein N7495_003656 [Penicillium taxi]